MLLIRGECGLKSHADISILTSVTPRVFEHSAAGISGLILVFSKAGLYSSLIQRRKPILALSARASMSES